MPRFFTDNITDNKAVISGDDAKHIVKVLRCRVGEKITICDLLGYDYECEIAELGENVVLNILSKAENKTEPTVKVHLFQALPKSDKMEMIIQKAVELGVCEITPVMTARCVSRPDDSKMSKKIARYNAVAKEAAKQSGRGIIPVVNSVLSYKEALEKMCESDKAIIFYENGGERVNNIIDKDIKSVSVIIGSEGGFEESEVNLAKEKGAFVATLGERILRCETAPLASLAIIMNITENM